MTNTITKLRDLTYRAFNDGFAAGVMTSTIVAGMVDYLSDDKFDHPYLIGIPLLSSMAVGLYHEIKYGKDKGLSALERELKKVENQ